MDLYANPQPPLCCRSRPSHFRMDLLQTAGVLLELYCGLKSSSGQRSSTAGFNLSINTPVHKRQIYPLSRSAQPTLTCVIGADKWCIRYPSEEEGFCTGQEEKEEKEKEEEEEKVEKEEEEKEKEEEEEGEEEEEEEEKKKKKSNHTAGSLVLCTGDIFSKSDLYQN
ncbi:hypothetical protein STEG23_018574 [Scotinomys teguina]